MPKWHAVRWSSHGNCFEWCIKDSSLGVNWAVKVLVWTFPRKGQSKVHQHNNVSFTENLKEWKVWRWKRTRQSFQKWTNVQRKSWTMTRAASGAAARCWWWWRRWPAGRTSSPWRRSTRERTFWAAAGDACGQFVMRDHIRYMLCSSRKQHIFSSNSILHYSSFPVVMLKHTSFTFGITHFG